MYNAPLLQNAFLKNRHSFSKLFRSYDVTMTANGDPIKLVARYPYKRLTTLDWETIRLYYQLGYSVRSIGRCYGYNESNIRVKAKKENWEFGSLDKLIKTLANAISQLDIEIALMTELEKTLILKEVNCHMLATNPTNPLILLYLTNMDDVRLCNLRTIPKRFMPTQLEISNKQKLLKRKYNSRTQQSQGSVA